MADAAESSRIAASINDISALLSAMRSGALRDILGRGGGDVAGCSGYCECVGSMCGCNHIVSAREWNDVSYPEFQQRREARIHELREKLRMLEEAK